MPLKLVEITKSDVNFTTSAKAKLTRVRKELDVIEERFSIGKIDGVLFLEIQ